ncbi:MAG: PaaI family thioesterase [Acidimicrobiales bacterium]
MSAAHRDHGEAVTTIPARPDRVALLAIDDDGTFSIRRDRLGSCFGCGLANERGLQLRFRLLDDGGVATTVTVPDHLCGVDGVVHGGIQATILDEVSGVAAQLALPADTGDAPCVTAELALRFRRTVDQRRPVAAEARVTEVAGSSIHVEGCIVDADGTVLTRSTSRGAAAGLTPTGARRRVSGVTAQARPVPPTASAASAATQTTHTADTPSCTRRCRPSTWARLPSRSPRRRPPARPAAPARTGGRADEGDAHRQGQGPGDERRPQPPRSPRDAAVGGGGGDEQRRADEQAGGLVAAGAAAVERPAHRQRLGRADGVETPAGGPIDQERNTAP